VAYGKELGEVWGWAPHAKHAFGGTAAESATDGGWVSRARCRVMVVSTVRVLEMKESGGGRDDEAGGRGGERRMVRVQWRAYGSTAWMMGLAQRVPCGTEGVAAN
jgi:hypothetical protein